MAVSPLAMAEQSKKFGKETILQALKEMGALDNKNITMGEVWKKVRHKFPAYMQAQLDLPFSVYKDEKIPQFDLTEIKNSNGDTVVALNMKDGDDTARIEFPGKENQFMKFNGVNVTDQDIANPNLLANKFKDEKIVKKDFEKYEKNLAKRSVFPTYEQWSKMTPYLRASFMVEFRRMMKEVETVLNIEQSREVKTSALDFPFLRLVLGEEACAAGTKGGLPCIIGGNVGKTRPNGLVCTLGDSKKLDPQYTNGCNQSGKHPQISCNPMLYGYNRNSGERICFDYNVKDKDKTLHATSRVCESESRLKNQQDTYELVKSILKKDNGMTDDKIKELFIESDIAGQKKYKVSHETWEKLWADDGVFKRFETAKLEAERVCKPILDENRKTISQQSKVTFNPRYELPDTRQQTIACETIRKRQTAIFDFIASVEQRDDSKTPLPSDGKVDDCPPEVPAPVVVREEKKPDNIVAVAPVVMKENKTGERVICATAATAAAGDEDDAPTTKAKDDDSKKPAAGGFWSGVKNFFTGPWGKVLLFGGLLAGVAFGTYWGLSRLLKRKDTAYKPPYVYPSGTVTTPTTPSAPTPIEGGAGSSPATGGGVR